MSADSLISPGGAALPHRAPFLLVDRVTALVKGERILPERRGALLTTFEVDNA